MESETDQPKLGLKASPAPEGANGSALQRDFCAQLKQKLGAPLNAILELATLVETETGLTQKEDAQKIGKAARELLQLVNNELGENGTPSESASATRQKPAGRSGVLYIEDDNANFTLVQRILKSRPNLELMQATNARRGLELAHTENLQLILLDLNLPDLHGSEVLRRLQLETITAKIPVVVISADATSSQIERLLTAGARNYLTKPLSIQNFVAVVDEIVEASAA